MMGNTDGFPYPSLTGEELEALGFDKDGNRVSTDKQIYDELDRKLGRELRQLIDERASRVAQAMLEEVMARAMKDLPDEPTTLDYWQALNWTRQNLDLVREKVLKNIREEES